MKSQGVSIIICCHNGASRLRETVRHIARQQVPENIPWELVLVDNGSTDDTAEVARTVWRNEGSNTPLRVVYEPVLGLSHARTRGFEEASYSYIVLCDDDNWLDENYVYYAYEILLERPNVGALGGFGKLAFETETPFLQLSYIFAAGQQAERSGKVPLNRVYGAGCVIRYAAYEKLFRTGFKSLLTDRRGAELSSGGDYELCYALAILGYDIWYDERLRFTHFITGERLTWEYFVRYAVESSRGFNVLSSYRAVAGNLYLHWLPSLVLLRNFLLCSKILLSISVKRLLAGSRSARKSCLHFNYLVFKYKWVAYFTSFARMVETHERILHFREACTTRQHTIKPAAGRAFFPSLRLSFFSKPSRPLP